MDAKTIKYLEKHPEVDTAVCKLVKLLATAKADHEHGKTGLVCLLRAGSIEECVRIQEFTDRE